VNRFDFRGKHVGSLNHEDPKIQSLLRSARYCACSDGSALSVTGKRSDFLKETRRFLRAIPV
jgi:hypothetical protein